MVEPSSLANLKPGEFFHAEGPNGARAICLVTSSDSRSLEARIITIQLDLIFDVNTGVGHSTSNDYCCKVNSVKPVPDTIADAFRDIDRKYRLQNRPEGGRLLKHEIAALLFADRHYYAP
jgi:hypothetical protein